MRKVENFPKFQTLLKKVEKCSKLIIERKVRFVKVICLKDLTKGNIYKTFLLFAIPLILAGLLSQSSSIIDTVIAGKMFDSKGLAAIGATSPFIQFFSSFFWGYGIGYSIYIANLFGAGDYKKVKTAIYINYYFLITFIFSLSIITVVFKEPVFNLLSVDKSIRDSAYGYFVIYMLGIFFVIFNTINLYVMNALGSSTVPFLMSVLITVLHIAGNVFAVKVLKMGINGIAASTVLSAAVVNVLYFAEIKKCLKKMGVEKYKVKFSFDPVKKGFFYSLPTAFQQLVMYFSSVIISPIVNGIGGAASAAYIICLKVYDINASVYQNSAKTLSNYVAQSMGAGKYENVKKGLKVGFLQGVVLVLPFIIFCVIFAKQLCMLFLTEESGNSDVLNLSFTFVRYYIPLVIFDLVNNLLHGFYRSNKAMNIVVIVTVFGSVSRIISTFVLVGKFGMNGVYAGWAASWILECIFTLILYFSGVWKSDEIKKYELKRKGNSYEI